MIESHLRWLTELPPLALELLEREEIPEDVKVRIRQILDLEPKLTRYTPRIVRSEVCTEPE